ncbi:adhesion G-protein coupled receptor G6-like [Anneissia japonica]|uniref:adhesion G-protein coupled receptor G6-like n=1 Tax=Anneissia japonica TaxID=1529436 RepID=UPI0014259111|nr:adhesion G-protein coupled receptor G6-like [Anneissia japonica]
MVYLYCVADGVPTPTVQWVEISENGEFIYINEPADRQTVVILTDESATKRFACLAVNVVNQLVSKDVVISQKDPKVIIHPESQVNDVGSISILKCEIQNIEFYKWYKNGKHIPDNGPTYSLQLEEGQDQGDYACVGFRSQDAKDAMSNTATVLITGVSTFRVLVRFNNISFEIGYTNRESTMFKSFSRSLQTALEGELSTSFELFVTSIFSGSVIAELEMYFSDQAHNASALRVMISDALLSLPEYETDPTYVIVTSITTCIGEKVNQGGIWYSFPDAQLGTTAESTQVCPLYSTDQVSLATRYCGGDFVSGAMWSSIIIFDCDIRTTSEQIERISEFEVTEDNGGDVADALANVTNNTANLDENSTVTVSRILEDIVGLENPDESITLDVVEVIDNVIESGVLGTDLSMRETSSSFVTSLERQLATVAAAGMNFTSVLPHISVMTLSVSSYSLENSLKYVAFSEGDSVIDNFEPDDVKTLFEQIIPTDMVGASIALPPEIISISQAQTGEDEIRVYFTVYQNSSLFISNKLANKSTKEVKRQVGSHIISTSIEAVNVDGLVYPVKATFLPRFTNINNTECVFWDFSLDDGVGDWSSDGCTYNKTEDNRIICLCDHLTNFAILVDYYEPKDSPIQDVLTIISLIGCIVSIVCLAITIFTYLYFKKLRSKRPQLILINLSISLFFLYLVFVSGINQTGSKKICIAIAALLHYFGLASVFWMSIEAVNMYLVFVKVFYDDIEYFMLKVCAVGYGVPFGIVAICMAIDIDNYENAKYCFISSGNIRNFGFILVIGVLLLLNWAIFFLVMYSLTCGRTIANKIDQSKRKIVIKRLQSAIAVSVLLGLTWVFGFLAIDSDSSARDGFQALFCIFNSLQGLFIFMLFCVRQKDIRDAWNGCYKEGDRGSRVKYTTNTTNKGKVEDRSIPLTNNSTEISNTKSN